MRLFIRLLPVLTLSILFSACSRRNGAGPSESASDYFPLKPGNYWIYESWRVDANGNGQPGSYGSNPPAYDSVYAIADTVMGNRVFHRYCMPTGPGEQKYDTWSVSDSGDYLIEPGNHIQLALKDSATSFMFRSYEQPLFSNDSAATVSYKLEGQRLQSTPAGITPTLSMAYIWNFYPFAAQHQPASQRVQSVRFAKGIGMVSQTLPFYMSDSLYVQRRLLRYHLQ